MKRCHKITLILLVVVVLFFLLVFIIERPENPKIPIFSIESTTVKAFNLTVDNLFCIISLSVRARNPNPTEDTFDFRRVDMEVRKGVHHALASDALRDFSLGPACEAVIPVEAVGLRVEVKRKISAELVADLVAPHEGRVNVYLTGIVGPNDLGVSCKNVAVDFSRSTVKAQRVDCEVTVTPPPNYLQMVVSSFIVSIINW